MDVLVMTWGLTLARVATFLHFLPLLGGPNVPRTVKIGLAMALSIVFYEDACAGVAAAGGMTPEAPISWLRYLLAVGREVLLGAIMGFALSLFLMPARIAGEFIAQESGITFANVVTASGGDSANPFATLFEMIASAAFFALDLHHLFLRTLQETFRLYPVSTAFGLPGWNLVTATGMATEGGLLLAAPMALCLVLTTVVMMLMSRAAPQLNLFSVGFPMRVIVSLAAMLLLLPQLINGIVVQFAWLIDFLNQGR